jgi:leader peptidase (prepilin peptidase)/N-methyltransferase
MELLHQGAPAVSYAFAFAFGAVVGSFLNVVIARVPHGQSLLRPGSRCPKCEAPIAWYDNVPVLAWLWLRGKCRRCGQPISPRYPIVELLVGLLAMGILRRFGPTAAALGYFAFASALVALAYIDIDTWLLPHEITWPTLIAGAVSPLWNHRLGWLDSLIGGAAGVLVFGAIALFGEKVLRKEIMGWGDVWLLGGIGAWLGWAALLPVILLSALQGALVGGLLLALGKAPAERPRDAPAGDEDWVPPPNAVPFGPFLVLGALEQLLAGDWMRLQYDRFFAWVFR